MTTVAELGTATGSEVVCMLPESTGVIVGLAVGVMMGIIEVETAGNEDGVVGVCDPDASSNDFGVFPVVGVTDQKWCHIPKREEDDVVLVTVLDDELDLPDMAEIVEFPTYPAEWVYPAVVVSGTELLK